jgi:GGDEF domain-containing protein
VLVLVKNAIVPSDAGKMVNGLTKRDATAVRVGGLVCVALLAAYVLHALTGVGDKEVFGTWLYEALLGICGASCLLRARLLRRERLAWSLLGIGLLLYTAAEIYFAAVLADRASIPIPSLADAGWLAFYPFAYASLVVLLRDRLGSFPVARWLDGLIVGTAVAALAAALVLKPIVDASVDGSTLAVATNLAYPLADLTLLSLVFTAATLTDWRPGRAWAVLGAGLVLLGASDVVYLLQVADGTYVEGTILDAGWPPGVLLLAAAAWIAPTRIAKPGAGATRTILIPAAAAVVAIGVQGAERFTPIPPYAQALSLLTLLAVVLRLALTLRESRGEARSHLRESRTDELTGLPNRRALIWDLGSAIATPPTRGSSLLLALFDLDGLKLYNDSFGHPAGDALLARLGRRLGRFAAPRGRAYRLGGDEFCLLVECTAADVDALIAGAGAALSERGEGFEVTASRGSVLLPSERPRSKRPCSWPTGGCTRTRRASGPRPARSPVTSSSPPCANGNRASPSSPSTWASSPRRSACPPRSATRPSARPSSTRSARWRSRTRSSTSRAHWRTRSGNSSAATR